MENKYLNTFDIVIAIYLITISILSILYFDGELPIEKYIHYSVLVLIFIRFAFYDKR